MTRRARRPVLETGLWWLVRGWGLLVVAAWICTTWVDPAAEGFAWAVTGWWFLLLAGAIVYSMREPLPSKEDR